LIHNLNSKKKIAFVINFGPEVRPFILSNLVDKIGSESEFVYFVKSSSLFFNTDYILNKKVLKFDNNEILKTSFLMKLFHKMESFYLKIRKARLRNLNFGNYHFSEGSSNKKEIFDFFFGAKLVDIIYGFFLDKISQKVYHSDWIANSILKEGISDIIIYENNFAISSYFKYTGKRCGTNVFSYVGNWKDIYTDTLFTFLPRKIFVWSNLIKDDLVKINPRISRKSIQVTGNWFFYKFRDYLPVNPYKFYIDKYKLDPMRPLILWPLSMKVVFPNEHLFIKMADSIVNGFSMESRPIFLLRDNPFGCGMEQKIVYSKLENVRMANNYWHVDLNSNVTIQDLNGEIEWLDLLYYCKQLISLPSTVSLEAILFKKSILNILFDENGNFSEKISAFSNSPFYSGLNGRPEIYFATGWDDLSLFILGMNTNNNENYSLPAIIDGNEHDFQILDSIRL
jgi:hypothetical protein